MKFVIFSIAATTLIIIVIIQEHSATTKTSLSAYFSPNHLLLS